MSYVFFFFKQKTAYEMRISDWSSDVCSSDLLRSSLPNASDLTARSSLRPSHPLPAHLEGLRCPAGPPVFSNRGDENSEDARHARKRSEERRVGHECVSTFRSRGSPPPSTKHHNE